MSDNTSAARVELLLHDDWELNGDGTGDIRRLMFEPARRILDICDQYGAKYTFFAEVGQQFAMLDSPLRQHQRDAAEWEAVLLDAVQRGHDVQLHLHPQWSGAQYVSSGWRLNYHRWNIAALPYEKIVDLITSGKQYLEGLLGGYAGGFVVNAFRAGGWMCQPSTNLVRALEEAGIVADVSVIVGKYADYGEHGRVDFRRVPSQIIPWRAAADDLARSEHRQGIVEIPTYTEVVRLPLAAHLLLQNPWAAVYYAGVLSRWRHRMRTLEYSPSRAQQVAGGARPMKVLYCSFGYLHHSTLWAMVERFRKAAGRLSVASVPLIMLTHSKSFYSYKNFQRLLGRLAVAPHIDFARTRDVVRSVGQQLAVTRAM